MEIVLNQLLGGAGGLPTFLLRCPSTCRTGSRELGLYISRLHVAILNIFVRIYLLR